MAELFEKKPTTQANAQDAPPEVAEVLARFLERHQAKLRPWPESFPEGAYHAARFWIDLMEPPHPWRDVPQPRENNGKRVGWFTPYHDRLLFALQKFCKFTPPQQVWIIEHVRQGIPWRGDDGLAYAAIIDQTKAMHANPAEYVGQASAVLRGMRK